MSPTSPVRAPRPPDRARPGRPAPADRADFTPGAGLDAAVFDDRDLSEADGSGATLLECALRTCVLDRTRLRRARLLDSVLADVRGVGTDLSGAVVRDVEVIDARLGGVQLSAADLTRVAFRGGKIDYLNLRQARLTDVTFTGCVLNEPDFAGARLERVSFEDCEVRGADLSGVTLHHADLRGTRRFEVARGVDRLAGAVVTPTQLLVLAPLFAAHLGLRVED